MCLCAAHRFDCNCNVLNWINATINFAGNLTLHYVTVLDPCWMDCRLRCFDTAEVLLVHLPPHRGLLIWGPGNGAPPPSKSSLYAIIYDSRAETKHTSKVYDAAPLNERLGELIRAVIFVLINHGCFAKLGPLQVSLVKLRCRTTLYMSHRPQIPRNPFAILFICCARVRFAVAGICDLSF